MKTVSVISREATPRRRGDQGSDGGVAAVGSVADGEVGFRDMAVGLAKARYLLGFGNLARSAGPKKIRRGSRGGFPVFVVSAQPCQRLAVAVVATVASEAGDPVPLAGRSKALSEQRFGYRCRNQKRFRATCPLRRQAPSRR